MLEVREASTHNLQHVDVDIPLGVLVVGTGVAGSGKSSPIQLSVRAGRGLCPMTGAAVSAHRAALGQGCLEPKPTHDDGVEGGRGRGPLAIRPASGCSDRGAATVQTSS